MYTCIYAHMVITFSVQGAGFRFSRFRGGGSTGFRMLGLQLTSEAKTNLQTNVPQTATPYVRAIFLNCLQSMVVRGIAVCEWSLGLPGVCIQKGIYVHMYTFV